ncbi:MAG: aminodeoxychorismate/anthranilate synthase component II [Acidobacteriota bacterium]
MNEKALIPSKIFLIDNYDSFTFNLYQYLLILGSEVKVCRNDRFTLADIEAFHPTHIVISPGPGRPEDAGLSIIVIEEYVGRIPILGVCLGHQCIGVIFGGKVDGASSLMHGKISRIYHDGKTIYQGLSVPFEAGRYHSLAIQEEGLPSTLEISAYTIHGEIMGVRVKGAPVEGIQFHPESVLTPSGMQILTNFLLLPAADRK